MLLQPDLQETQRDKLQTNVVQQEAEVRKKI